MKVIFGKQAADELSARMTILELDTFNKPELSEPITAYAVIDSNDVKIDELPELKNLSDIHNTMMFEFRRKNWSYCHQALEHLEGKFSGTLDSFYEHFKTRLGELEKTELSEDWDGSIR